jgi:prophage maintenance system killer protein
MCALYDFYATLVYTACMNNTPIIYQAKNGAIELRGDSNNDTIWATQSDITQLFLIDQSVVSRHINNIFKSGEVSQKSNMQKMHIANSDKPVVLYSLDVVLAVGYRTNSSVAINFRKWSTSILRSQITDGFSIDPKRIKQNYAYFSKSLKDIGILLPYRSELTSTDVLDLVQLFAKTWFSLDAYDKGAFNSKTTKKIVQITGADLTRAIATLKTDLVSKQQASELFAQEKYTDAITGIVGNVFQTFDGVDVYPSLEEKAAHLLYFIVKNHPFTDGNKRSGAFAFVWFLQQANMLNSGIISPEGLTALTLLIAESNPKEKERMIGLVLLLLNN